MVRNIAEISAIAASVSLSLHDRCLLGCRPTSPGQPGKFRKIEVKVRHRKKLADSVCSPDVGAESRKASRVVAQHTVRRSANAG